MLTEIHIRVDESILASLNKDKQSFAEEMLFYHALLLYRQRKLSLDKAAELAGYDKMDFTRKLQAEGEVAFGDGDKRITETIKSSSDVATTAHHSEQPSGSTSISIALEQIPVDKQRRLNFLTEKNREGTLTQEERSEFEALVQETQSLTLQNTEILAHVIRPDLFDKNGRPVRKRIDQAVRAKKESAC